MLTYLLAIYNWSIKNLISTNMLRICIKSIFEFPPWKNSPLVGVKLRSKLVLPKLFPWSKNITHHYLLLRLNERIIITNTVKPVLTTTSEQRPPVNNDHPKSRPTNFSSKVTSEQRPPVNNDQRPLKFGPKWYKTCL